MNGSGGSNFQKFAIGAPYHSVPEISNFEHEIRRRNCVSLI